jgi:4-hydroxybenzoate polyprenyltransferase
MPTWRERLDIYEKLTRLDKPVGILLLLWPTLWGQWLAANGRPHLVILWIFVLGTVLMRSAGCVVNDYADRDFDPHVARTKDRPLAARALSTREALLLAAGLALAAFLLILPLNSLVLKLSFVALFLAASYPFTKRFFAIPQAYLGLAFGFGIPMSFAAQAGHVPLEAWVLMAASAFWSVAYDTEYAMVDRDDDLKIGIKTSAITFGRHDLTAIAASYLVMLALLAWCGPRFGLGWPYTLGLAAAAAQAVWHLRMIRAREPAACFRAFRLSHWIGATVFAGIVLDYAVNTMHA